MFKKIILLLAAVLAVFLIFVATRSSHFTITRSAAVAATPAEVFPFVNDLHKWQDWSPWAKLDPNAKATFEGPPAGVGASFAWAGNNEVGEGRMTITESHPNERVLMKLEFFKPMQGTNVTEFTLKPDGTGTKVTWTMSGDNGFVGKLFGVIMDCDKMVGSQFEKGFENLKSVVHPAPAK